MPEPRRRPGLSFGSFREYGRKIRNNLFRGPQGRAIARSTPFHAYKTLRVFDTRVSFVLNARSAFCGPPRGVVEGGGWVEQGEADFNSTSAWCGGRTAGHNSPWAIPGRVAWRGARMGRRMRHGGWWKAGHGRQGEWWQVARWGLTSTRSTGGGRRADRPPSRVVPECVAWSCPGVVAPMLYGGLEGRRQRRDDRRRGRESESHGRS